MKAGDDDLHEDGRPAFFFRSGEFAAVTLDGRGANLPVVGNKGRWSLERRFTLGIRHVGLQEISPEPIIRGIAAHGYYVWQVLRGGEGQSQ